MTTETLDQLRSDLVTGIDRRLRRVRRRRRMAAGVVGAGLIAVVASLATLGPSGGTQALAIAQTPEWIELRIQDASAGPDQMNSELREAGVDAEVQLVPAPPSRVGTWIAAQSKGPGAELSGDQSTDDARVRQLAEQNRILEVQIEPSITRIPKSYRGHVILLAGRDARPGEQIGGGDGSHNDVP